MFHVLLLATLTILGNGEAITKIPKQVEEIADRMSTSPNTVKAAVIVDGDKIQKLESVGGSLATRGFMIALVYSEFPGEHDDIATASSRPTLYIVSASSPRGRVFLAKAESKKGKRAVKMGQAGMFGYSGIGAPDPDWTVAFSAEEVKPGLWALTLKQDLAPGEYGLLVPGASATAAGEFFGFGVGPKK